MNTLATPETAADINKVAEYLGDSQLRDLASSPPADCIVICASEALFGAETILQTLQDRPETSKCLVLCGGIGHSTHLLYRAVSQHPRYSLISDEIHDLPEARVLEAILNKFFDRNAIMSRGCQILIEDQSTNCGQNAAYSRKVLENAGFQNPTVFVINQDPTMMLRTRASFEKVYEDVASLVSFVSYPAFIPKVQISLSTPASLELEALNTSSQLWSLERFVELIMGEIPRVKDDESGYGPKGRGFISHVDLPMDVEAAWSRLRANLNEFKLR